MKRSITRLVLPALSLATAWGLTSRGALQAASPHPLAPTGPRLVWSWSGDAAGAAAGKALASAGDVNGDGYADLLLATFGTNGEGNSVDRVLLFSGSPTGLQKQPSWTYDILRGSTTQNISLAPAGDVTGDGIDDFLIGVPYADDPVDPTNLPDVGQVMLFAGSPTGPASSPDWSFYATRKDARLGTVAGVGDVNGDGIDDFLVGAYQWKTQGTRTNAGAVWVFAGSKTGISQTPFWFKEWELSGALFGFAVAGPGDVDGDGLNDLLVGAYRVDNPEQDEGAIYLYFGAESGISSEADTFWSYDPDISNAWFGSTLARGGDVNADGFADILAGSAVYTEGSSKEGGAFLFQGLEPFPADVPSWKVLGAQTSAALGGTLAGGQDLDSDGYDDVLVGAAFYDKGQTDEGIVLRFRGGETGLAPTADWTVEGDQKDAHFGSVLASLGDTNADGCKELAIGAPEFDDGQTDEGKVFVYSGDGPDGDGDGTCLSTSGVGDCNDGDPRVYPGATELEGDGIDEDCNGLELCFVDSDRDGFRDADATVETSDVTCTEPGHLPASAAVDCNDADVLVNPGAGETCNYKDDNCNGSLDEGVTQTFYQDQDQDGYGDPNATIQECSLPAGHVADNTDCDDDSLTIHPGATELVSNGIDENCDLSELCYVDADEDGYRDGDDVTTLSSDLTCQAAGLANTDTPPGDCADDKPNINPAAQETCDGADENCNLEIDEDTANDCPSGDYDLDGYTEQDGDCNDLNDAIHPEVKEVCDELDNDCNGIVDDPGACPEPTPVPDDGSCSCNTRAGRQNLPGTLGISLVGLMGLVARRRKPRDLKTPAT